MYLVETNTKILAYVFGGIIQAPFNIKWPLEVYLSPQELGVGWLSHRKKKYFAHAQKHCFFQPSSGTKDILEGLFCGLVTVLQAHKQTEDVTRNKN